MSNSSKTWTTSDECNFINQIHSRRAAENYLALIRAGRRAFPSAMDEGVIVEKLEAKLASMPAAE